MPPSSCAGAPAPQRIEVQQSSDEGIAEIKNELDRFDRLQHPDDAGQHTEHAGFGAIRHCAGRRRLWKQAPIARPAEMRREDSCLSIEAKDRAVDIWLAREDADVVRQVA